MSIKELLTRILNRIQPIGTVYEANWTASSSSANNTNLTDSLILPIGTYIITLREPGASAVFSLGVSGRYFTFPAGGYGNASFILEATEVSTVRALSAQSASVTFNTLGRGKLMAVRIA